MNKIDSTLRKIYSNKKYGELSALYQFFNDNLISAIESELSSDLANTSGFFENLYVDFQWIDKIPLADFHGEQRDINHNLIEDKTELGDLFIQYRHTFAYPDGKTVGVFPKLNYSLVVQAKISDEIPPVVPVGKVNKKRANSTSKELKLLEHWPEFDLYETARSLKPLVENIHVQPQDNAFSFFAAFNNHSKAWLFGKAKNSQICDLNFSDIIFGLKNQQYGKDIHIDTAWGAIASSITDICQNRKIPQSIANKIESRQKSAHIKDGTVYTFPLNILPFITDCITKITSLFRKKKMLVIFIDRISFEGPAMEKYRKRS